jgi:hypothetical protein
MKARSDAFLRLGGVFDHHLSPSLVERLAGWFPTETG